MVSWDNFVERHGRAVLILDVSHTATKQLDFLKPKRLGALEARGQCLSRVDSPRSRLVWGEVIWRVHSSHLMHIINASLLTSDSIRLIRRS